jgi:endoglucanase
VGALSHANHEQLITRDMNREWWALPRATDVWMMGAGTGSNRRWEPFWMSSFRATPYRRALPFLLALLAAGCAQRASSPDMPSASDDIFTVSASLGRGVNFGNMLEAPHEGDWGRTISDADIDRVAHAGFSTIRLPVRFSNHAGTTAPYRLDSDFLARVDHVVDRALADHLSIIIDFHNYSQIVGDPPSAQESRVEPDVVDERFVALWAQIAEHFRDRPKKVIYELLNEPHKDLTSDRWNVLLKRTLQAVRAQDPYRAVIIGPTGWNSAKDLAKLDLPNDRAIIVTIHNYEPFDFTHQGAKWVEHTPPVGTKCCDEKQIARLTAPLEIAAAWGKEHHRPIFLGEFGAYEVADMDSRAAFTLAMRQAADKRGMSWAYWEYNSGFGVYDPKADQWVWPLRDALLGPELR